MKTFFILHNLVADSGHILTIVKADNEENALRKYKEAYPDRWHIGIQIEEITQDVQTVYRYDNPNYEG